MNAPHTDTPLLEFYGELSRHDWHYEMSDDLSVWRNGCASESRLREKARRSPVYQRMFDEFYLHMFSGQAWGTKKRPKPEKPEG